MWEVFPRISILVPKRLLPSDSRNNALLQHIGFVRDPKKKKLHNQIREVQRGWQVGKQENHFNAKCKIRARLNTCARDECAGRCDVTNTDRSPQTLQRSQKPLRTIRFAVVSGCAEFQHCRAPSPKAPSQQPPHVVWARHHCTHLKITTLKSNDPHQCGTSGSDFLLMEIGRCFNQTFHQRVSWCVVINFLDDLALNTWASPLGLFPPESFHCTTVCPIWHRTLHRQPLE